MRLPHCKNSADFCDHEGTAYRIFSSAQRTVKRFALLHERIGQQHIYDLQGKPKSSVATFRDAAKDLGFSPERCLYVDDSPLALQELEANLIAKLEYFNPAGSVKDRIGFAMIKDAEEKGLIQ